MQSILLMTLREVHKSPSGRNVSDAPMVEEAEKCAELERGDLWKTNWLVVR